MKADAYGFDGTAKIRCRKCGMVHEVAFDGNELDTVDEAINRGMETDGWDSAAVVCPNCFDAFSEMTDGFTEEDDDEDNYDFESDGEFEEYDLDEEEDD